MLPASSSSAPKNQALEKLALKDTQEDEYYQDILPEGWVESLNDLKKNPYPGLRPFKTSEASVFFGRKAITHELITRLATHRFLAVLGASGTGKSSLVRAGLLPGLKVLPGKYGLWKVAICRPGKNPFGNLAKAISKGNIAPGFSEYAIWQAISSSSFGFEDFYTSYNLNTEFNTLIIIDQFEELFRYRKDSISGKNDSSLFVKMLVEVSKLERLNTYVMITMRSEYLGDCLQFPALADEINDSQFLVPRLKEMQLKEAIVAPTGFSNASVDPVFAKRLLGEIGDNMDQLPVLQHSLRRTYEVAKSYKDVRNGIVLTYEDYNKVGRMENAIDDHANEIYNNFNTAEKQYCEILFKSITVKATDGRGVRRPLSFQAILSICSEDKNTSAYSADEQRKVLSKIINYFRADKVNFLMPPLIEQISMLDKSDIIIDGETEIDISHESLMRIWKKLQLWIEEEASDAILLEELLQRDLNEYIKGSRLAVYKEWLKRKDPKIKWALLYKPPDITPENYQQKLIEAIALIKKKIKTQNVRKITAAGIPAVIFLSLAVAFSTTYKYGQLGKQYKQIDKQKTDLKFANQEIRKQVQKISKQYGQLDSLNFQLLNANKVSDSLLVAIYRKQDLLTKQQQILSEQNEELVEKNSTISRQANDLEHENKQKDSALYLLKTKEDSLKTVSTSATNLKNLALAIRHAEKSMSIPVNDLKRENIKAHLALVAYQLYLESSQEEREKLQSQVYTALYSGLQNIISKDKSYIDFWQVTPYQNTSDHLASGAIINNRTVYLTGEDKSLYSFDLEKKGQNRPDYQLSGNKLISVEASTKGWLAANTLSKKLLFINNANRKEDTVVNLTGNVRTSKFSPDGSTLYVYTRDSTLSRINLSDKKIISKQKVNFRIEDIAISDSKIYALTNTGDIVIWDKDKIPFINPVIITSPVKGSSATGTTINCKPDNSLIVWGNDKGEVSYLQYKLTNRAQYLTKFAGPVTSIAFNFSYDLLAIASYDKSIQVFSLPNLQSDVPLILSNNEGRVSSIFFQKNRKKEENLVAVIGTGIIRIYPMSLKSLACRVSDFYKNRPPGAEDLDMYIDKEIINNKVTTKCN